MVSKKPKSTYTNFSIVILLLTGLLTYDIFLKDEVEFNDWQESMNGHQWWSLPMPFYTYVTHNNIYLMSRLSVPEGLTDFSTQVFVSGCIRNITINNFQKDYGSDACKASDNHDLVKLDLTNLLLPGNNTLFLHANVDGGVTRFTVGSPKDLKLIKFLTFLSFISILVYQHFKKPIHVYIILVQGVIFLHLFPHIFIPNWGFDKLIKYNFSTQLILTILSLIMIMPQILNYLKLGVYFKKIKKTKFFRKNSQKSRNLMKKCQKLKKAYYMRLKLNYLLLIFLCLVLFFIFWGFRTLHSFGDSGVIGQFATIRIEFYNTAPLTSWMIVNFYDLVNDMKLGFNSYEIAALQSCILGVLFIIILWKTCFELFKDSMKAKLLFLFVISGYFIQLFFGYIEFYGYQIGFLTLFLYMGLRYLNGKSSVILPSLSFGLMMCSSMSSVFMGPSLVVIIIWKNKKKWKNLLKDAIFLTISTALIPSIILGYAIFINGGCEYGFIDCILGWKNSLSGSDPYFFKQDLFSMNVFYELFNEYVLLSPMALVLTVIFSLFYLRKSMKNLLGDGSFYLIGITCISWVSYTIIRFIGLGFPQDWDCLTPSGLLLPLLIGYCFLNPKLSQKESYYYLLSSSGVNLLIHTVPLIVYYALYFP